ncbi:MAG: response regulator [Rickettsiales bacterium]
MLLDNKNILAIDDTLSIRTFLRISLQAHGATFHEAATANDGLELCNKVKPDLVVLDLGLPDRDGLDILPEIKKEESEKENPKVIILSVRKDQQTKHKAFTLGADGYLSKPFLMEDLLEIIEQKIN